MNSIWHRMQQMHRPFIIRYMAFVIIWVNYLLDIRKSAVHNTADTLREPFLVTTKTARSLVKACAFSSTDSEKVILIFLKNRALERNRRPMLTVHHISYRLRFHYLHSCYIILPSLIYFNLKLSKLVALAATEKYMVRPKFR